VSGSGEVPQEELAPMLELDDADGELVETGPAMLKCESELALDAFATFWFVRGGEKRPAAKVDKSPFNCALELVRAESARGFSVGLNWSRPLCFEAGAEDGLALSWTELDVPERPNLGNSNWKLTSLMPRVRGAPKVAVGPNPLVGLVIVEKRFLYSFNSTVILSTLARRSSFSWLAA